MAMMGKTKAAGRILLAVFEVSILPLWNPSRNNRPFDCVKTSIRGAGTVAMNHRRMLDEIFSLNDYYALSSFLKLLNEL